MAKLGDREVLQTILEQLFHPQDKYVEKVASLIHEFSIETKGVTDRFATLMGQNAQDFSSGAFFMFCWMKRLQEVNEVEQLESMIKE